MRSDLRFVKMHGAGNDYVYVDGIAEGVTVEEVASVVVRLADRHLGVGGDGLILMAPSEVADVRMVMWNADGSRGPMCGNGLRCLAKLAHDEGHVEGTTLRVETDGGVFEVGLTVDPAGEVVGARVPMPGATVERDAVQVVVGGERWGCHRGQVGNLHAVVWVEDPELVDVERIGAGFQELPEFQDGVNVEFVRVERAEGVLVQRTYERGAGETLACGTGATIAALCAMETGRVAGREVEVVLRGGRLTVRRSTNGVIEMEGGAVEVFRGVVRVPRFGVD